MVKLIITLLLINFPVLALSSPSLRLVFEQDTQQLGYAFDATIIADDSTKNLSEIDLTPLEKDFGIIVKEYSRVDSNVENASEQRLSMELYPRHTGIIKVPSLKLQSESSAEFNITTLPAKNTDGPINIEYHLASRSPWQRQQVLLTVKLTTPNKFSHIETTNPQNTSSEFRTISISKETISDASHFKAGWAIFPLESGAQKIMLPPVLYHTQGTIERRFYPPEVHLDVKALPSYIPPLMPVGKIGIDSKVNVVGSLNTGDTYNWSIRLYSDELLSRFLPPILRQIQSSNDIRFLAAESIRHEVITGKNSRGEVLHRIPFQTISNGKVTLPVIRIQHFDPVKGRVILEHHYPEKKWSLAIYWKTIIWISLFFTVFHLGKYLWLYINRFLRKRKYINAAIFDISNASNIQQLRNSLHIISRAENWPKNMSLHKWEQYWNNTYSPSITNVIEELSKICYTNTSSDITNAKTVLINTLDKRQHTRNSSFFRNK